VDDILGDEFPVPRWGAEGDSPITVTVVDGAERIQVPLRGGGLKWRFNVNKLPRLLERGDMELWRFHGVPLFSARARRITDRLVAAARRGETLYDPE
jgi:hypothetical protein